MNFTLIGLCFATLLSMAKWIQWKKRFEMLNDKHKQSMIDKHQHICWLKYGLDNYRDCSEKQRNEIESAKTEIARLQSRENIRNSTYQLFVDGKLKRSASDYYDVLPLSKFGKNVCLIRCGEPLKWIGKGKQMYEGNAAQMNLEI